RAGDDAPRRERAEVQPHRRRPRTAVEEEDERPRRARLRVGDVEHRRFGCTALRIAGVEVAGDRGVGERAGCGRDRVRRDDRCLGRRRQRARRCARIGRRVAARAGRRDGRLGGAAAATAAAGSERDREQGGEPETTHAVILVERRGARDCATTADRPATKESSMKKALLLALAFCATNVLAQGSPTSMRLRGTIEKVDPTTLVVKERSGETVTLALADNLTVAEVMPVDPTMIQSGAFIGTAAVTGADGKLSALEVLVFPEAMRGTGEGHSPWDLQPGSTMTNATVTEVVHGAKGRE